jgi:hypothetical protein
MQPELESHSVTTARTHLSPAITINVSLVVLQDGGVTEVTLGGCCSNDTS